MWKCYASLLVTLIYLGIEEYIGARPSFYYIFLLILSQTSFWS